MRLLLTRAPEDAARTRAKLEAAGHEVHVLPVIETRSTCVLWPRGVVDAVIATSAKAFNYLAAGCSPEARRLLPLYLVGERTAEEARGSGFLGPAIIAPSAADLLATMQEEKRSEGRLLYLAGVDRKPNLEVGLQDNGFVFDVLNVYEAAASISTTQNTRILLTGRSIDGVLHFSRRSASLFLERAEDAECNIGKLQHFCLSEDVAWPLRAEGCGLIHVAEAPNEAALLALLGA